MTTLFADDHQIIKDEYCSAVSLAKVWTFAQVHDFIDIELQNKMTLGCGEFLKREREMEREREREENGFQASIHVMSHPGAHGMH